MAQGSYLCLAGVKQSPGLGLPVGDPSLTQVALGADLDSWQLRPNLLCVASLRPLERELPFPRCLGGSVLVPHPSRLGCCLASGPPCALGPFVAPSGTSVLPSFQSLHSQLSCCSREAWGLGTSGAAVDWIDSTEIYYQVIKPIYSHSH